MTKPSPTYQTFRVCGESTDRHVVFVRTMSADAAWHLASLIDPKHFSTDGRRPNWRIVSIEHAPGSSPVFVDESQDVDQDRRTARHRPRLQKPRPDRDQRRRRR